MNHREAYQRAQIAYQKGQYKQAQQLLEGIPHPKAQKALQRVKQTRKRKQRQRTMVGGGFFAAFVVIVIGIWAVSMNDAYETGSLKAEALIACIEVSEGDCIAWADFAIDHYRDELLACTDVTSSERVDCYEDEGIYIPIG